MKVQTIAAKIKSKQDEGRGSPVSERTLKKTEDRAKPAAVAEKPRGETTVRERLEEKRLALEETREAERGRSQAAQTLPTPERARTAKRMLEADSGLSLRRLGIDALLGQAQAQTQPQTPEEIAEDILDVGQRRFQTDDYEARVEAFAEFSETADPDLRAEVMAEIYEQDSNAFNSWLRFDRVNHMVEEGRISDDQRAALAEAVAGAFNDGHLPGFELPVSADGTGTIATSPLDGIVLSSDSYGMDSSGIVAQAEAAEHFVDFFTSSKGPEADAFRESYGRHLIDTYVLDTEVSSVRQVVAGGIAAELLTSDYGNRDLVVDTLASYTPEQREQIYDSVVGSANFFDAERIQHFADLDGREVPSDVGFRDGFSEIMRDIAWTQSPNADTLAVELARMPRSHEGWFVDEGRADQLQDVFRRKSEPILDALTLYDRTNVSTTGNSDAEQYEENAQDLAALLELTVFDPDGGYRVTGAQNAVLGYAEELKEQLGSIDPSDPEYEDLVGRLSVLSAASSQAITNGFDDLANARAAQEKLLGFAVDLALSALPLGSIGKAAVANLFPEGALRDAIQGLRGKIVNETTGRLTTEAKEQLYALLDADEAALFEARELQNWLEAAFVAGLPGYAETDVVTRADSLADDLAD